MKVRLTRQAAQDLTAIGDYVRVRNPQAALRVRTSILETLELLTRFPGAGRAQTLEGVRKIVTRRYRYLLYYRVDDAGREIVVLTIQHPARRRAYSDA